MSEPKEVIREFEERARAIVVAKASAQYGREFDSWKTLADWLVREHFQETLRWEYERIDEIRRICTLEGKFNPPNAEDQLFFDLKHYAETQFRALGGIMPPYHSVPSDIPTNDERMLEYFRQLDDPESPLRKGNREWNSYHIGVQLALGNKPTMFRAQTGCLLWLILGTGIFFAACVA